jgi:hypothetical protein
MIANNFKRRCGGHSEVKSEKNFAARSSIPQRKKVPVRFAIELNRDQLPLASCCAKSGVSKQKLLFLRVSCSYNHAASFPVFRKLSGSSSLAAEIEENRKPLSRPTI